MAATQRGRATIFGAAGTTNFHGAATGTLFNEGYDLESDFQTDELRDEVNDLRGFVGSGEVYRATIRFTPVAAANGANTIALAKNSLAPPSKMAKLTLTGFDNAIFNSTEWVYVGGWRQTGSRNGIATYELRIARGAVYDCSTEIS